MTRTALVIRDDHLGDLVLTTPLLRSLSQGGYRVDVIARARALDILQDHPFVNEAHSLEEFAADFPRQAQALSAFIRKLQPDVTILPYARSKALCLAVRKGTRRQVIAMWGGWFARLLGFKCLRSRLTTQPRHMTDIWLDIARFLKLPTENSDPHITIKEKDRETVRQLVQAKFGGSKYIVVHPGCGGNTCNIPASEYGKAVKLLLRENRSVIVTGNAREKRDFDDHFAAFAGNRHFWNSMGSLQLSEMAALIAGAEVLISTGTGPLHLASATKTATISPFCRKIGVCQAVWGNTGSRAAIALEPPPSICENSLTHCDFQGTITAEDFMKALGSLQSQEKANNYDG